MPSLSDALNSFVPTAPAFPRVRNAFTGARDALDVFSSDWFTLPSPRGQRVVEVGLVSLLTLMALLIRFWDIGSVPSAPAGDESAIALETIRILNGEWIGIWSGAALGNPAGHMFWVAPFFWLGGATLTMLRLSSAVLGVALVPVCYLMVRMLFPFPVALVAAAGLVFFSWFVIIFRIGIPVTLSVFIAAAAICLTVHAARSSRMWIAVVAGIALGAGLFVFKGYVIYFGAIWGATLLALIFSGRLRRTWGLYLFLGVAAATGAAMIEFYVTNDYLGHNLASQYHVSRAELLSLPSHLARMGEVLMYVHIPPPLGEFGYDGIIPKPLLHPALAVFFWVGLVITLLFINRPSFQLLLLGWLIGMAPAVLVPGGETRRYLLGVFFVLVITAVGFAALAQLALNRWLGPRDGVAGRVFGLDRSWVGYSLAAALALALIAGFAVQNLRDVNAWARTQETRFQFDPEIARASEYLDTLDARYAVNFYSVRWSVDYETVRWFAPSIQGTDGSSEFGGDGTIFSNGVVATPTVFMLLGGYLDLIGPLRQTYPGGREHVVPDADGRTLFIAYIIDDPPAPGTVTVPPFYRLSPNPEGERLPLGIPSVFGIHTNEPGTIRVVVNPSTGGSANLAFAHEECPGSAGSGFLATGDESVSIRPCQPGTTQILLYREEDGALVNSYWVDVAERHIDIPQESASGSVKIVPDPSDLAIRADPYEHHALHLVADGSALIVPSPPDAAVVHNNPDLRGRDGCAEVEKRPEGDTRLSVILPGGGPEIRSLFYVVGCAPGAAALRVIRDDRVVATYSFTISAP